MRTKYIFVAGGVMSGIGKGITIASIGVILKNRGFKVQAVKIDPYINVDAGTMNPIEHGEVFVTDDGDECDQDIGNYERFLDQDLGKDNYMTTGRIYLNIIKKERNLDYRGKCVQVVPHVPNEVIERIKKLQKKTKPDFILIEIGGTVGEYENLLFLEAARMLKLKHPNDVFFVLVSYLPVPKIIGEMKTKPTQHAVRMLNSAGIQPDLIIARSVFPLDKPRKKKISVFCNVAEEDVISAPDVDSIYDIPLNFEKDNMSDRILKKLKVKPKKRDLKNWAAMVAKMKAPRFSIKIGIVGKYFRTGEFTLMDSYISVIEAVKHAACFFRVKPKIIWLDSEKYEDKPAAVNELTDFDGIIIPGGFGSRGVEGKIKVANFCRIKKIPFLGICLGMQLAVVGFARTIGLKKANSTEFDKNCQEAVIDVIPEQKEKIKQKNYGGSMRLGAYACRLKKGSVSRKAYSSELIFERHRHRYEFNNEFRSHLEKKGLTIAGVNPEKNLVEIIEIKNHPFFVGVQFHPEFKSRPLKPHPLFKGLVSAALKRAKQH